MINSWVNLISKTWPRQGVRILKAFAFPSPLAAHRPVTAREAAGPWLWSGHQRQRSTFSKVLTFHSFFDCRRVSARQMTALTPSSTARRGSETCTRRRDAKRWVRAVKLNGEHSRLLRAGQQQEPCLALHQGTNPTWNSNKRGRWFDSTSKALSTPPHPNKT